MSTIQTIAVDLTKNVFSIHGVDAYGKCVLHKTVKRNKLLDTFAKLPPSLIGMEACSGVLHWARELLKLGHNPKIMASKFVFPYRQNDKNDAKNAEAICEAISRSKRDLSLSKVKNNKPWLLATNTPRHILNKVQITNPYATRMQIEEAFRDLMSTAYGIALRHNRTRCTKRLDLLLNCALKL
ncbi:hypothetical protein VCR12J2_80020 [Vibrio coralliirubri]|nr:transposase [Vibrio sp. SBT000027]CDU06695.1 hypothetical protein VCR12J2_80020 [Vibrio coralliirubri]